MRRMRLWFVGEYPWDDGSTSREKGMQRIFAKLKVLQLLVSYCVTDVWGGEDIGSADVS